MAENSEDRRQLVDAAMVAAMQQPANDSRLVFERLADYTARGIDAPHTLSPYEIRQISYALSLYLSMEGRSEK